MKRSLAVMLLLCASLAATAEPATAQRPPNVVLIVTDDQRWDTIDGVMSVVANELAVRGMRFGNAFVTNPLCCPSRASILTGQYPHTHGVYSNRPATGYGFEDFDDSSTIATWLDDAGYQTGLVGRYLNGYEITEGEYIPPGWDDWFAFVDKGRYSDYQISDNGEVRRWFAYSTDALATEAAAFVRGTPDGDPLFLLFAPRAPHAPFTPAIRHAGAFSWVPPYRPLSYDEADVSDKPTWVQSMRVSREWRRQERDQMRIGQLESLLAVDEAVGRILDALEQTNRLTDTLIVFTSDNGFQWGEHRLWGKNTPYDASTRVPLIMRYDRAIPAASIATSLVANIDLAPTIAALAGVTPEGKVDGLDLSPLFADPLASLGRAGVLIEHGVSGDAPAFCGFRTATDLFIRYATGEEEFYDYRTDPFELQNLADFRPSSMRHRRETTRSICLPVPPGMTSW